MKKLLLIIVALSYQVTFAQIPQKQEKPTNWHLLDFQKDGYHGISLERTYDELLKNKQAKQKVIVAVIDCGVDYTHPDLENILWTNPKEIEGNGIDDDKNGYIDDIHGWNFIGGRKGATTESIREYVRLRKGFENLKDTNLLQKKQNYAYWQRILKDKEATLNLFPNLSTRIANNDRLIEYYRGINISDSIDINILKAYPVPESDSLLRKTYNRNLIILPFYPNQPNLESLNVMRRKTAEGYKKNLEWAQTTIEKNDIDYYTKLVGMENQDVNSTRVYGNNNLLPQEDHGTLCSGIITGVRNKGKGMDGITNNIALMPIRIFFSVQGSDELDKDVANAIFYAVNNGAKVINMSFGKYFSPQKKFVDEAIKYAESKGILIFSSAGNDNTDNDIITKYPSAFNSKNKRYSNFTIVGATTSDSTLLWNSSNYGKKTVDFFAPGSDIFTTAINHTYSTFSGTSFSAPMASGIAALLWSYYPTFTYKQIKYCLEKSVKPINQLVYVDNIKKQIPFNELSRLGGIVNTYEAFLIAEKVFRGEK